MASRRFVLELKLSDGVTNASAPQAFDHLEDAEAAATLAAPAGGYRIVDSWRLGYVREQTTALKPINDLTINESTAFNIQGNPSETWPI